MAERAEASQSKLIMLQCTTIFAIATVNITQDDLYPGLTTAIARLLEKSQRILCESMGLREIAGFIKKHGQLVHSPGYIRLLIMLTMQNQTTAQTSLSIGILTLLTQDCPQTAFNLALAGPITKTS